MPCVSPAGSVVPVSVGDRDPDPPVGREADDLVGRRRRVRDVDRPRQRGRPAARRRGRAPFPPSASFVSRGGERHRGADRDGAGLPRHRRARVVGDDGAGHARLRGRGAGDRRRHRRRGDDVGGRSARRLRAALPGRGDDERQRRADVVRRERVRGRGRGRDRRRTRRRSRRSAATGTRTRWARPSTSLRRSSASGPPATMPDTLGATIADGRLAVPLPAGVTASVGGDDAPAVAVGDDAATERTSACPTSAAAGVYVSSVAPGIGTQPAPAASQRLPLVRERDRLAAAPRARDAGEDGARPRGARDRRRRRDDGRARRIAARSRTSPDSSRSAGRRRRSGRSPGSASSPSTARTSSRSRPSSTRAPTARRSSSSARSTAGSRSRRSSTCRRARSSRSSATRR